MSKKLVERRLMAGAKIAQISKVFSSGRSEQIRSLQASETLSDAEVALRFTIVIIVSLAVAYGSGQWIFAGWAALYIASCALYLTVLEKTKYPVSNSRYALILVLNVTSIWIYASFTIYCWSFTDDRALQAVAIAALGAHIVYNITRHTLMSWPAVIDILTIVLSIGIFAFLQAQVMEDAGGRLMVISAAAAVSLYYAQAHIFQILERADLARRREEAMERQKDSAIGQITAGIAHDFNNILTAIQGNIDLADITPDLQDKAELLEEARKSTHRASDIVAQLMAYVGKSQLRVERLSLDRLYPDIQATLMGEVSNKMQFSVELTAPNLTVAADRDKLLAALQHLARNAAEAARQDNDARVTLTLSSLPATELSDTKMRSDIPYTIFLMKDNGPGIPAADLDKVSDPFFTTKPKGGGAGLGLAMVKGYAKQSGGTLRLRNGETGGLEAALILPSRVPSHEQ